MASAEVVSPTTSAARSARRERRLWLALVLNLAVVAVQVVAGFAADSLGLLADAGHNLTDVLALGLSVWAVRLARRPADARRSFGWHRSTVLAAQANAALLLAATGVIVFEAIGRLGDPPEVRGWLVVAAAGFGLVVNAVAALALRERDADLNVRAAMLHLVGDAAASAGVLLAGLVIALTGGWAWLDPVVSLVIAVLIGVQAVRLLREASDVLLEAVPTGLDVAGLTATMAAVTGVEEVHDLHAWSLSPEVRALSAHLVMAGHPTLEEAQAVAGRVRQAIAVPYGIAHATFELECEACVDVGLDPCAIDGLSPSAADPHAGHRH